MADQSFPISLVQKRSSIDEACPSAKQARPTKQSKLTATNCANCGTDHTPLWRRAPDGSTVCNACGLYLKSNKSDRPSRLKKSAPKTSCSSSASNKGGSCAGDGHCNGTGGAASCAGCPAFHQSNVAKQNTTCANCSATTTPLWRRDDAGATICNACGLYYKLHKMHRPVSLKKTVIKRRKRFTQFQLGQDAGRDGDSSEAGDFIHPSSDNLQYDHMTNSGMNMTHTMSRFKVNEVPAIEDFIVRKKKPEDRTNECLPKYIIEFPENEFDTPYHSPNSIESVSQPSANEPMSSDDLSHLSQSVSTMFTRNNIPMAHYTPQPRSTITLPPIQSFYSPGMNLAPISPHISPSLPPSNMSHGALVGYREELEQQVQQLNTLIHKTSTLLQGVDHALHRPISSSPPPLPPQSFPFMHQKW